MRSCRVKDKWIRAIKRASFVAVNVAYDPDQAHIVETPQDVWWELEDLRRIVAVTQYVQDYNRNYNMTETFIEKNVFGVVSVPLKYMLPMQ